MSCEVINPTAALPELGEVSACTYTTYVFHVLMLALFCVFAFDMSLVFLDSNSLTTTITSVVASSFDIPLCRF